MSTVFQNPWFHWRAHTWSWASLESSPLVHFQLVPEVLNRVYVWWHMGCFPTLDIIFNKEICTRVRGVFWGHCPASNGDYLDKQFTRMEAVFSQGCWHTELHPLHHQIHICLSILCDWFQSTHELLQDVWACIELRRCISACTLTLTFMCTMYTLRGDPNEHRQWSPECTKTTSKEAQRVT